MGAPTKRDQTPAVRFAPLPLAISLAITGALGSFASTPAFADCPQGFPADGSTVICSGTIQGYSAFGNDLVFNILSASVVKSGAEGMPSMSLVGTNITVNNAGHFDPTGGSTFTQPTTGLKMEGIGASNLTITNSVGSSIRGASGNLSAALASFDGMAIDVLNSSAGLTSITNSGIINSITLSGTTASAEMRPVVAIYGGGVVNFVNNGTINGRVAFESSSTGNTFTNTGSILGSLSLGAGGNNRFIAVTASVVSANGASAAALGNSIGVNLEFAPVGVIDGGANGNNTLTLRNAINSGTVGTGTISSTVYTNFSNLVVQSGSWDVTGALLSGATTSVSLAGGALTVNNDAFAGTGTISASGGTLSSSATLLTLGNDIELGINVPAGSSGLILSGSNEITLNGVISGANAFLIKDGAHVLRLNGVNTYSNGTILNGGTTIVGTSQAFGTGDISIGTTARIDSSTVVTLDNNINMGDSLIFGGSNDLRLNGAITGSASNKLTKTGSGNLTLGGANSAFAGGIDLNAGTLTVASSGALGSGTLTATGNSRLAVTSAQTISSAMTVNSGATLDFDTTAATTHNGGIFGTGTLAKTGSADLLLTTTNNFTGNWDVREGSLTTTAVNALGSDPGLNVASGASVSLGGNTDLTTLSGSGLVSTDSRVTVGYANVSSTFNGQITGLGSLLKVGSGTMTLGGINTYTGATTINVGRVNVAAGASLASNLVTVSTGGTLGGSGTVNAVTVGIGGRLALSSGSTLTTGSLTLSSGAILDLALSAPTLMPMLNIVGNLSITASTFNITDAGGLANGNYRLLNYSGGLTGTNLTAGSTPSDLLSTDIGRVFDIAGKTLTLVINSPTLGTQYWDGNNTLANGVIEGGSGVWSSSASNWTKADGNTNQAWAGKTAVFAGSTGVVLVQGQQLVNALQFKTDGYVLVQGAAGALDLVNGTGGTASVVTGTGISAQIATSISGTGKLTKSGGGTLILSGSNSYSGGTVLSAGTLVVRSDSALGTGNLVLGSGTTLVADSFPPSLSNALVTNGVSTLQVSVSRLTLGGVISGAGGLIKTGSGTLVLNGSNTMLGNFNLTAGGLTIGNGLALGSGSLVTSTGTTLDAGLPGVSVDNNVVINGDLTFLGNRDMSLGGVISGTGNLIHNGGNALNLTGANTFDGTLTLKGGTLRLGQNTSLGNAQLNVTGSATLQSAANISVANAVDLGAMLTVTGSNDLNLSGVLTGAGELRKSGTGTLNLSGNNQARTGTTEIDNGTLRLGHANALGSGNLSVNGIATLESSSALTVANAVDISGVMTVGGSNDLTLSGVLSGSGGLTKSGTSTLTLGGVNTFGGTYQISAGRLVSNVASGLGAPSQVNVASGATLQIVQGGSIGRLDGAGAVQLDAGNFSVGAGSFGGALSGSGNLVKTGTGTLRLNGNSNFSGATTIDGGVLLVDGTLGSGSVLVNSGAYLSGVGTLVGAVTVADGGHLDLAGGFVMNLGSLVLNNDSNIDATLGAAIPGAAGLANVAGNLTLDGKLNISNGGGFGAGVYRLFDYGGLLTNNGLVIGTLPNGVPANELVVQTNVAGQVNLVVGAPFDVRFWDGSELSGNGSIEGGNGTWNSTATNWTGANGNLNSAWLDTFAVFQGTAGFVDLTSAQRVTGLQFVTSGYNLYGSGAGELVLVNGSNGATNVRVDSGVTADLDVNISGAGTLNKLDSGTLVLNGSNSYSGGTLLAGGRLVVGNDNALGSGSLRVTTDASFASNRPVRLANDVILDADLTFNGAGGLTLDGAISGSKGLIKEGAMTTLVLNGSSSYAGDTVLDAGTLRLGHNDALGSSVLKVTGSGTLQTVGVTEVSNRLQIDDNLTFDSADSVSLSGRLGGGGVLTKTGTGTLTLSGTNDFLGQMNISTGQVTLQGITGLGAPSVNLQSGTVLKVAANSTLNQLTGSGNVELANSTLTVNGGGLGGSFSGSGHLTKVGNGSLMLAGNSAIGGALTVSAGTVGILGPYVFSASAVNVASGASLTGLGGATFDSTVNVADGGSLGLASGNTMITGALNLSANSILAASLGAPVDGAPGLLRVNGNLVLDGKLDVTDIGGFGMGVYRLIDYTGTLTDNGLSVGTIPGGLATSDLEVQTSTDKQVNLVVGGAAGNVLFWDGNTTSNGIIEGGSGTWGTTGNWTTASGNFNQAWLDGAFAVFQGTAGSVTVDGLQNTTGLQFLTDGYTLANGTGDGLNLVNGVTGFTGVRVGSGNTATLAVALSGNGTLNKLESGTLVLNGDNSYSGGTLLNGGTLVVGSDLALGSGSLTAANGTVLDNNRVFSLGNAVVLNGGLSLAGSNDLSLSGVISGSGTLVKNGNTTLTLNGNNSYQGGTLLNAGSLILGHNTALGSGALSVLGNTSLDTSADLHVGNAIAIASQLTLTGSHDLTLGGVLSGNGSLIKNGQGDLILGGASTFSGATSVNAGNLIVNGSLASASVQVASGAGLGGGGTLTGAVSLADGASLNVGSATAPLTVGSLALASGSNLNFALGAPGSTTSLVKVSGDLTLDGTLNISNAGGFGIGVYQLFTYGGSLTDNGLTLDDLPTDFVANQMTLQTNLANQVNLVVDNNDGNLLFWNGTKTNADGTIAGGSGVWGPDTNWTNSSGKKNDDWSGGQFAVFGGASGTVTVSGVQTFSGIQFITDGYVLDGGDGDALEAVNAPDGSPAILRVADSSMATIHTAIIGTGGIEKLDTGTLFLTGSNSYSGGTTISGGTLMGNTSSLQGNIVDNASLIFQQDSDGTFDGTLSGTGEAIKRGAGTLLMTGYNDFSGNFIIQEGVLEVGRTAAPVASVARVARFSLLAAPVGDVLAANVVVNQNTALTGTGSVASILNRGVVHPGANGNLTVTGNFTNTSDGTLSIALTPLPTSHLDVGGSASLAGKLNVFAIAPYSGDTTYTLLTAAGGISGTFDEDNVDSLGNSGLAFIDTVLDYGTNDLTLSVSRNAVAFADVAETANQRSTAAALESSGAPASLRSEITSLDRASAVAAFDSLSGEIHASTASVLLEDSRHLRNSLTDRMRQADCGDDPRSVLAPSGNQQQSSSGCQGQGVGWMSVQGAWADHDGSHGAASVDRDLSGFMLGYDNALNDQWRAGIAAGYSNTDLKTQRHGDASVDSYHLASYLNYQQDAFSARLGAGYSWHDIETKRQVSAGGYNAEQKAKYKAGTAQVFGEVAYAVKAAGVALEPFAGVAHVRHDSDKGREKGGDGRLETSSEQNTTFTTVGLRAGKAFTLDNGTTLTPRGSLGWRHALGDTRPDADLRFIEGGAAFSSQGVVIARNAAVVEAGLDVGIGEHGKLGIGYNGQLSSDSRDHGISVSFSLGF
ncbi:autotransporter-associated beta strand repeat-containing protein [Pseudomonas sp. ABC1]|uniref:autotransporter-associated beta strand repeat-containing protein n=1 Tax=Pseudomonas sp. ABC1 TaxID=2748080 RepID=UPI0015C330DE|nr:autotransporter-associated beta strand repeat-containing protein [Pseudomonas sp. ABC1]QLF94660.1 autotransporter-associated beta strand repeat-containing protein [Pseudomonas sp. ABC1]